jgi:CubicO group peptidase (beta-lactamase class C family)
MDNKLIQAVESGLLTANVIAGTSQHPMNLKDRMEKYCVPGVSIAVINDLKIEWAKGYGLQEAGLDTQMLSDTLLQAASISKPISTIAALKLVEDGKIDLDQNVNQLLSSWEVPENEFTQSSKVTLREILSHTAGLTVHGFRGYSSNEEVPTLLNILDGSSPANSDPIRVNIEPGSETRYSGGGYTVLQQLLEDVSGEPFDKLLQNTVLKMLDMQNSTFEQPLPKQYRKVAATAHDGKGIPIEGKWHTYPEKAAAGLWTTPTDLAKVAIEIIKSSKGQSNKILSVNMVNEMLTPIKGEVGLGFGSKQINGTCRFSHGGGNEGFRCYLVAYLGSGQGAVVMTNGDNGNSLVMEIIRSIAKIYRWSDFQPQVKPVITLAPDIYSQYEGSYALPEWPDFVIHVERNESQLLIEIEQSALRFELYPESETTYFSLEMESSIEFIQNEDGIFNSIQFGPGTTFKKLEE